MSLIKHTDGVLVEEKHGYATSFKQLMSELLSEHQNIPMMYGRRNVTGFIKRLRST